MRPFYVPFLGYDQSSTLLRHSILQKKDDIRAVAQGLRDTQPGQMGG
jgi:hypothetical protein